MKRQVNVDLAELAIALDTNFAYRRPSCQAATNRPTAVAIAVTQELDRPGRNQVVDLAS